MILSLIAGLLLAPAADTLQAVTIVADKGLIVSRTDTVRVRPTLDASATLSLIPGLHVGDYGWGAGLKSVSLRGLGSAHTAVYLDGVRVGNVQSGQGDLALLGADNFGSAVVDYAQNSVSFNTLKPSFGTRAVAGRVRLDAGSFGTWKPYGRLDFRLSDKVNLSAHAAADVTAGDFPLADGTLRANNDLRLIHGGADAWGLLDRGGWHAKLYASGADRGTPGSLSWPSPDDRQSDRGYLAQGTFRRQFTDLYELRLSAKGSFDDLRYKSTWGDSSYSQTELQINSSHKFTLRPWWAVSAAAGMQWDALRGNVYNVSRLGTVAAVASAFRTGRLAADIALEYTGVFEQGHGSWNKLAPSAQLRLSLLPGVDVLAFGRRAYRVPVFNELYYPGYGNPSLRPEDAWLADVGADLHRTLGRWRAGLRLDGFYNRLTDKIISAPSEDPYVWLPYNIGKVEAFGADLLASLSWSGSGLSAGFTARYGWQEALDKTPDSYTFGQQIPYVARHTLVLSADAAWKGWSAGAVFNLHAGRSDSSGEMPDWNTLDLSASKEFKLPGEVALGLRLSARNLLGCRYEVIRDYPMPGRSLLGGIEVRF